MDETTPRQLTRRSFGRLGLAAAVAGATATSSGPPARAAGSTTFRVGTLNILFELGEARFMEDLRNVASRADLVGLQETGERRELLTAFAQNNGWHLFAPTPSAACANAMLARKSMFDVVDQGSIFVCDTGGPSAAPPPRYNNWVRYEDRNTGRRVVHVNTHLNSHIDDNGFPYDLPRTRDAEDHLVKLKNLVLDKKDAGQVIVTGDFNVDYVDDKRVQYAKFPYTVLEERQVADSLPGLRSHYSRLGVTGLPTHGSRRIDYVYEWLRTPEARVMDMDHAYVFDDTNSDHNGVVARFVLQP
jgi:endonuclease/exonuclease/phosphatase (EEP) superfamily protein YafD